MIHCVKTVRIRSKKCPYPVEMGENAEQNNCEHTHFSRSDGFFKTGHMPDDTSQYFIRNLITLLVLLSSYQSLVKKKFQTTLPVK